MALKRKRSTEPILDVEPAEKVFKSVGNHGIWYYFDSSQTWKYNIKGKKFDKKKITRCKFCNDVAYVSINGSTTHQRKHILDAHPEGRSRLEKAENSDTIELPKSLKELNFSLLVAWLLAQGGLAIAQLANPAIKLLFCMFFK